MKYKITSKYEQIIELPDFDKKVEKEDLELVIFDKLEDVIHKNEATPEVLFWNSIEWREYDDKS